MTLINASRPIRGGCMNQLAYDPADHPAVYIPGRRINASFIGYLTVQDL